MLPPTSFNLHRNTFWINNRAISAFTTWRTATTAKCAAKADIKKITWQQHTVSVSDNTVSE